MEFNEQNKLTKSKQIHKEQMVRCQRGERVGRRGRKGEGIKGGKTPQQIHRHRQQYGDDHRQRAAGGGEVEKDIRGINGDGRS